MYQNKSVSRCLATVVLLLVALNSSVHGEASVDHRVAQLLLTVIHSVNGPKLTRTDLKEILYRPGTREEIYLVTKSDVLVSFYIANSKAFTRGQAKLVPSFSRNGSPPTGSLGEYFEKHGQRISNIATGPKHITLLPFLADLDDPDPVLAYKVLPDKLLFLQEIQYKSSSVGISANR